MRRVTFDALKINNYKHMELRSRELIILNLPAQKEMLGVQCRTIAESKVRGHENLARAGDGMWGEG